MLLSTNIYSYITSSSCNSYLVKLYVFLLGKLLYNSITSARYLGQSFDCSRLSFLFNNFFTYLTTLSLIPNALWFLLIWFSSAFWKLYLILLSFSTMMNAFLSNYLSPTIYLIGTPISLMNYCNVSINMSNFIDVIIYW